jgi:hypothetical protein
MSEQPMTSAEEPPQVGWQVLDPDGNVVDSGPVTEAKATAWVAEMLAEAARNNEEEQQ